MSLSMSGHIDSVFKSIPTTLVYEDGGGYVDGVWADGIYQEIEYTSTVQPLSDRELENLFRAGERIIDGRKIYINSGDFSKLKLGKFFYIAGQRYKIVSSDIREWRNYAKIVVSRMDDQ